MTKSSHGRDRDMRDIVDDLGEVIARLINQKNAAPEGSAAYCLAVRELAGLRYTYEDARPIMEDLDPLDWGASGSLR
jgi:hypothetical protein